MTRTFKPAAAAAIAAALAACATSEPMTTDADTAPTMTSMASRAPAPAEIIPGQPVRVIGNPDQLSLLDSPDPTLARNKRIAFDVWRSVLDAGHVEVAEQLLAEDYIQHNPLVRTGRGPFMDFFSQRERLPEVPETIQSDLVSIVAEGDKVVFAFARELDDPANPGETYTTTWFDMFRIEDGRIAEHWDVATLPPGVPLVPASAGGPVPVTGATGDAQLALLESDDPTLAANKRVVFDVWRSIVDAGHEELAPIYLDENYIQHNPNAATGRAGMMAYFATRPDMDIQPTVAWPLVAAVAEGDLVVFAFVRELPVPGTEDETYTTTWFDMFRLEDGKIMEHWDIATKAPPPAS